MELYWIWLSLLKGIGPIRQHALTEIARGPESLWHASRKTIERYLKKTVFTGEDAIHKSIPNMADEICSIENREKAKVILEDVKSKNIKLVTQDDDNFPVLLKNIASAPMVLFVKGELTKDDFCIGIVGTRSGSEYGRRVAFEIAKDLAAAGVTIVSGMAEGIDTQAHKGCLAYEEGKTIAVLGSGLNKIYPYSNRFLFQEIAQRGAVITEYLPNVSPLKENFPCRNRIISGMCKGLVVVESAETGGSLITAKAANDQGRDVFAVPGNIYSIKSRGTNSLLKDGAILVRNAEDILNEYREKDQKEEMFTQMVQRKLIKEVVNLSKNVGDVYKQILAASTNIDELAMRTGLSYVELANAVFELELRGLISASPGGRYHPQY